MDPNKDMMRYLTWTVILIIFLIMSGVAIATEPEGLYDDLNKEIFEPIGIIKVETGNEKFEAELIKMTKEDDNVLKSQIKERWLTPDGQWCFVTIVIKQEGDTITKKEELHCADTKHGITKNEEIEKSKLQIELEKAKKPSYWALFANFYYADINTPEYCRYYSRKDHAFKSFGKVCLQQNGEWKVK